MMSLQAATIAEAEIPNISRSSVGGPNKYLMINIYFKNIYAVRAMAEMQKKGISEILKHSNKESLVGIERKGSKDFKNVSR